MNNAPTLKTALNYGSIGGIVTFLFLMILFALGINPLGPASWVCSWVPIVFIVKATINYRDHENGGMITYLQGIQLGFMTEFFGALILSLLLYIVGTLLSPELFSDYIADSLAKIQREDVRKMTEELIGEATYEKSIEALQNLTFSAFLYSEFLWKTFGGLLVSLFTAAIFKHKAPSPNA